MWKVRELADKVTNVVMNYTETEAKVREATNDDPWGPTGSVKHELAQATFSYELFPEVLGMLWKRIIENKGNPRRIYKSLTLLHHLLLHGSDRVVRSATDRLYELRQLEDYLIQYEPGFNLATIMPVEEYKNGELNVRVKAKEMVELVQDEERLREARKKAKSNRDKYVGISSDRMTTSRWTDNSYDDEYRDRGKSAYPEYDDYYQEKSTKQNDDSGNSSLKSSPKFESKSAYSNNSQPNTKVGVLSMKINPTPSKTLPRKPSADETDEDFADFQSAFGTTENQNNNTSNNANAVQEINLFGDNSTSTITSASMSGNVNFFGNDEGTGSGFGDFQEFQAFSVPSPQPQSLPIHNQLSGLHFGPTVSNASGSGSASLSLLESIPDFPQSQSNNVCTFELLQPQQTIMAAKSNLENPNANAKVLQGTTWSDLNFSLDSLDLKQTKPKPTAQLSMNQLLAAKPQPPQPQQSFNNPYNNSGSLF